jgi:hypothetical protein
MNTSREDKYQIQSYSPEHTALIEAILIDISKIPEVRAWKVNNGVFKTIKGDRIVKIGVNGSADISGILSLNIYGQTIGIRLEIEVKTGNATQRKEQKAFQNMIESRGGLYLVARSVEDARVFVKTLIEANNERSNQRDEHTRFLP